MRIAAQKIFLLLILYTHAPTYAQELSKICPISLKAGGRADSASFLLTTADYNFFRGKAALYAPAIEIIDGDTTWPPRWFALHPGDTAAGLETSRMILLNASAQKDKLTFFTVLPTGPHMNNMAIVSCNKKMEITDTFYKPGREIDSHDFKVSENGDVMYFLAHDTVMDLRRAFKNQADTAVRVKYETIEIEDARGRIIFSWDPMTMLGFTASYLPYRYSAGVMSGNSNFEWSHGNSLEYDADGDILYSFKHIGIGKISRRDGHVIWHIDRKNPKASPSSDAIPLYLQHDLRYVEDNNGNISYTVLSNGDDEHPVCLAYQFSVSFGKKEEPVIHLIKKISPSQSIPNTGGGGNFDMEANGNYLFNYGLFKQDSTLLKRILFEYKNEKSNTTAEYEISPSIFAYRIHKMDTWRTPRPDVKQKGNQLGTDSRWTKLKWYRLSGKDLHTVEYLTTGENYTPGPSGYYCVAAKYGIGWAVSRPYHFVKNDQ